MQSEFLFCAKTCFSATKELKLSQCWLCVASPACSVQFSTLRGWVMVLLLWSPGCMWAYLQESSQEFEPSCPTGFFPQTGWEREGVGKGQIRQGKVSNLYGSAWTRCSHRPSSPWIGVQFHLSSQIRAATLTSVLCRVAVFVGNYLLFCLGSAVDLKDLTSLMTLMVSQAVWCSHYWIHQTHTKPC